MGEVALQPAKACTGVHRSRSPPLLSGEQGKGPTSSAPVPQGPTAPVSPQMRTGRKAGRSQLSSSGMGLKHTGITDGRGFTLPCYRNGASRSQCVSEVSLQLPEGEMEEAGETPGH